MTNSSSGSGWTGGAPVQPGRDDAAIAAHGSVPERWHLAGRDGLPEAVFDILLGDDDERVLSALAWNYSLTRDHLSRLVGVHPGLRDLVALNRNAAPELKDGASLGAHTADSLAQYLDDREASPAQRAQLLAQYRSNGNPGDDELSLGRAWEDCQRP